MHVGVSTCMFIHTPLRACVCVCLWTCVHVRAQIRSQALPCEIRLICQWCRSSFMINSPACWKQCFCALATCGTDVNCTCVCASARLTAGRPTLFRILFRMRWCCKCGGARVNSLSWELRVVHGPRRSFTDCVCVWWCELKNTRDLICDISQHQIRGVLAYKMQNATFTGHLGPIPWPWKSDNWEEPHYFNQQIL